MKKLMIAAVAAASIAAFGVESSNIVGVQTIPQSQKFVFAGSMFVQPGQNFYYLNNVTVDSVADDGSDFIQFFKPGTTVLDKDQSYYFDGDDWCYVYDASDDSFEADDPISANFQIPVNLGFLTRYTTTGAANAETKYCGEVQQGNGAVIKVDRVYPYQIVINPLPRAVKLSEITVESIADDGSDFIQFFKPGTTVLDKDQAYYYDGDDWCYVYDASDDSFEADDVVSADNITIQPGEGFLIRFTTGTAANAKVVFPAPLAD